MASGARTSLLLALWLLLVLGGGCAALLAYHQVQSAQFEAGLEERATATLEALEAALLAHLHNYRYHPERLEAICEHLQAVPRVRGVRIDAGQAQPLAAAGEAIAPQAAEESGPWQEERYVRSALVQADAWARGPGHRSVQRGPSPQAGWLPYPEGPTRLSIALDTERYFQQLRNLRIQTGLSAAGVALLGLLGAWVILAGQRRAHLENALDVVHERAAQAQRLAQLGAGLAHETKNPLGIVRGLAQSIEHAPGASGEVRRQAQQIVDEADRTVGHIDGFITLARPQPIEPAPVPLDALFPHLLELIQPEVSARGVQVMQASGNLRVLADEATLRRALLNLLLNALDACGKESTITLGATRTGDTARLYVRDTGAGIPAALLPRVREPYVSGRAGGTGLGLSIVESIAQAHGWKLRVESEEDRGTLVSLEGLTVV